MPPTVIAKRKCFQALIKNLCSCFCTQSAKFMLPYFEYARLFHVFFYKFVASKNLPPKSLMLNVTSNLLPIKHPTNLFPQHGTSPEKLFVHVASSVGNLMFLEANILAPSSGVMNPKRSPETSVGYYHYSLRNNPDESGSRLLRGGSLK